MYRLGQKDAVDVQAAKAYTTPWPVRANIVCSEMVLDISSGQVMTTMMAHTPFNVPTTDVRNLSLSTYTW